MTFPSTYLSPDSGEDFGALLKMGMVRFVFVDEYNKETIVTPDEDGTILGPKEVGEYTLLLKVEEKGEDGPEFVTKAKVCEFTIYKK